MFGFNLCDHGSNIIRLCCVHLFHQVVMIRRIHVHSGHSVYLRIIKLMASSGLCLSCHIHNLHHGERDDNVAVCSSSCHVLKKI